MRSMVIVVTLSIFAGACGAGLERFPGAASAQAPVVNDHFAPAVGSIGRACGAVGSGGLRAVALSVDERLVAAGYGNGLVVIHAMEDGAPVRRFTGHDAPISALAFLSDGTLATASEHGDVKVWPDGGDASPRALIGASTAISKLVANEDGSVLVAVEASAARAWRVSDGSALWLEPLAEAGGGPKAFVVGRQRVLLVAGPRAETRDFDGGDRRVLLTNGLSDRTVLDVSPDGTLAVGVLELARREPGNPGSAEIGVFAYPHGERIWARRTNQRPIGARFTRDGARVVVWHDARGGAVAPEPDVTTLEPQGLAVYDVVTSDRWHVRRESPPSDHLTVVPVGAGDRLLLPRLAAPDDRGLEVVALAGPAPGWRAATEPGHPDPLEEVAVPAGAPIAITRAGVRRDNTLRAWDLVSGRQLFQRAPSSSFAVDGEGRHLVLASGQLPSELPAGFEPPQRIGDDLQLLRLPDGMVLRSFGRSLCYLAIFTPDGRHVWAACGSGAGLRRFDIATGVEDRAFAQGARPVAIAVSPDGARIATRELRSRFKGVTVWDVALARPLWQTDANLEAILPDVVQVGHLAFSPDGSLLAAWWPISDGDAVSGAGKVRVFAAATGKVLASLVPTPAAGTPVAGAPGGLGQGLAFSPDGTALAARGAQLTVWRTGDWGRFVAPPSPLSFVLPRRPGGGLAFVGSELFVGGADFRLHKLCDVQPPAPPAP
jgi:WD40 repeat protein